MQTEIATATAALKRFQRSGAIAPAAPTPHRLVQAGGQAYVERSLSFVDVEDANGKISVFAVKGHRIRVTAGPFETMVSRRQLDEKDVDRNAMLAAAGRRFLGLWTRAGLSPLRGQDPGKIRTTAAGAGLLEPERSHEAWMEYRKAQASMDKAERIAVEAIVLHEKPLEWVGQKIGARKDRAICISLAAHELRAGLEKLAIHFGLMVAIDPNVLDDEMTALLAAMDRNEATSA